MDITKQTNKTFFVPLKSLKRIHLILPMAYESSVIKRYQESLKLFFHLSDKYVALARENLNRRSGWNQYIQRYDIRYQHLSCMDSKVNRSVWGVVLIDMLKLLKHRIYDEIQTALSREYPDMELTAEDIDQVEQTLKLNNPLPIIKYVRKIGNRRNNIINNEKLEHFNLLKYMF